MNYFPFYMDMRNKVCLIVGGGKIAYHKARILMDYPVSIRVVAPMICDEFHDLVIIAEDCAKLQLCERVYQPEDIRTVDFIIGATDDAKVHQDLWQNCKAHGKLINMVDDPERSDFIFPAIWRDKNLMLTVSTGGKSPLFAAELKEELNELIPDYYSDMVELLGELREEMKERVSTMEERKRIYQRLIKESKALQRALTREEIQVRINSLCENK